MSLSHRVRTAGVVLLALAASGAALAQVEVPQHRQLGAQETLAGPGNVGADYSANPPSLSGLTLLATIPAPTAPRAKIEIAANCTAGITVVLDDQTGSLTPTIIPIAGPAANGGQGGSYTTTAHTGRVRIYSPSVSCQMAARAW
jgi:hypothetical protein